MGVTFLLFIVVAYCSNSASNSAYFIKWGTNCYYSSCCYSPCEGLNPQFSDCVKLDTWVSDGSALGIWKMDLLSKTFISGFVSCCCKNTAAIPSLAQRGRRTDTETDRQHRDKGATEGHWNSEIKRYVHRARKARKQCCGKVLHCCILLWIQLHQMLFFLFSLCSVIGPVSMCEIHPSS